ncbi:regulator of chromosome condensation 1/beta-lactamase-inhibitor protein II [Dichotomocladium elegans]|nr:regulator of chromosome condensation 1/beta-lactamase-inhibitor protein II [Dichotomocladium elegans]
MLTSVYGWGQAHALPLRGIREAVFKKPVRLTGRPDYAINDSVTMVAAGWGHSLLATRSDRVYGFGLNRCGQAGKQKPDRETQTCGFVFGKIVKLGCGREHSHIATTRGLYSFGNSMHGQLGLAKSKQSHPGTFVVQSSPALVTATRVMDIACGLDHTVFVTEDQSIYAMGWGADGQLGLGTTTDRDEPTRLRVSFGATIKKLTGSTDFTLALTDDGRLWTWGNSEYGQGMTGSKIDRILEPIELEHSGVIDIAAGGPFSVVLTEDGSVHTCGYGALGLGEGVIETLKLQRIPGLSNVQRVFATTDYAAAITDSGELFTWGLNGPSGRLGLGHSHHGFVPHRVELEKAVQDVALGTNHALALCRE